MAAGDQFWPLRAFRELDDAVLRLRVNEPLIGTIVLKTQGDQKAMLSMDEILLANAEHWLVREIVLLIKRTLKRLDMTARSLFALIEPGSCWAGTLFELALAADRSYMLDDPDQDNAVALSAMNAGPLKMANGLTRLETRFLGQPDRVGELLATRRRVRSSGSVAGRPGLVRARRARLGRRGAAGDREPRGAVARRADRDGSQPPVRRSRNDGNEDFRPADGLAELDLHPAECRWADGRLDGVWLAVAAGVRLRKNVELNDQC